MGSEGGTRPGAAAYAVCSGAAAVYCAADAAALCAPCDAAVHAANPLVSRHERVMLSAATMAAASGVYDDLSAADDVDAASSWMLPPPLQGQASPQGRSEASFATSDSSAADGGGSLFDLLSDVDLAACGVTGLPDGAAPVHHHHHCAAAPFWFPPGLSAWTPPAWPPADAVVVSGAASAAAERLERVRRYREKRKNRRFQKTIRYASRKAYAEARPRIKGRFVKRSPAAAAPDSGEAAKFWLSFSDDARDDGGVGFYMDAAGAYGVVVPSF